MRNLDRLTNRRLEPPMQHAIERFALEPFHRDVGQRADFADVKNSHDVFMIQRRHRAGFAQKPSSRGIAAGQFRSHELDGHGTVEMPIGRRDDNPHAAASENRFEPIPLDYRTARRIQHDVADARRQLDRIHRVK